LVQIGTASFVDPHTAPTVIRELSDLCERQGVTKISELVGALEV
jgi:dihydroorotate dehydrogenase (NAD+) catalytic subunit